jgi:hypothetical protein
MLRTVRSGFLGDVLVAPAAGGGVLSFLGEARERLFISVCEGLRRPLFWPDCQMRFLEGITVSRYRESD